jgi:hypothetical protein
MVSEKRLSKTRCEMLHEYVGRAHIQTPRELHIYNQLFLAIHKEKDYCSHGAVKIERGK